VALSALQKDAQSVRRAAEDALAGALAGTGVPLDVDRRCEQPELNLVPAVIQRWTAIAPQLGGGNGGELYESAAHKPKFCSAFSSCALAVNTFGRFDDTDSLPLPAGTFPGGVRFEAQRTAGVRGYKPNLDLVAEPAEGPWLFAESKCIEYLRPHTTAFSDAFVAKAGKLLSAATAAFYAAFAATKKAGAHTYELLDAAQLLKHFLAAKLASGSERKVVLTYLFWEPADEADHAVFAAHRDDAQQLAGVLADEHVRLLPIGYRELWSHWDTLGDAALTEHVAALRARYDVTLGTPA
jgi:hypothetical protein